MQPQSTGRLGVWRLATRTHPDPDNWIDVTYPAQDEFERMVADRQARAARKTVP